MDRELGHARTLRRSWLWGVLAVALAGACGVAAPTLAQQCADVVGVDTFQAADGTFTFSVTVRSDDLGWEGYADWWEVVVAGTVVGKRVLTHPHDTEQPFTRSLSGIEVGGDNAVVRAHHSAGGFCGSEMEVAVG